MPDSNRPLRVFLCHASQDKPAVRELYQRLKSEDWIDPWLDEEKLSFGQHWTTVIEDALHESDIVLIFLSRNSVQKEGFVQRELNYAWELSLEKPRNAIFLIPFRLDDCEIPRYLASRQWGDYFGEKKESTYQILLRSLKARHNQKLQLEAEEKDHLAEEESKRKQAEEQARKHKEAHARKAATERAQHGAEEQAKADREEKTRLENEKQTHFTAEDRKHREADNRKRRQPDTVSQPLGQAPERAKIIRTDTGKKVSPKSRTFYFAGGLLLLFILFGVFVINPLSQRFSASDTPTSTGEQIDPNITPLSSPTLGVGSTMISEKDGMMLLFVPSGEYTMGIDVDDALIECQMTGSVCAQDAVVDESPSHAVSLEEFWIDRTEVTNTMFANYLNSKPRLLVENSELVFLEQDIIYDLLCTECEGWKDRIRWNGDEFEVVPGYEYHPVVLVTWYGAKDYCEWVGRRLPSEIEWEVSARGKSKFNYPWGNDLPNIALLNYDTIIGTTTVVGSYPAGASPYGVLDMAGNVWEWVFDWYGPYPGNLTFDFSYGEIYKVIRGGSWNDSYVRTTVRTEQSPSGKNIGTGFRCAMDASK